MPRTQLTRLIRDVESGDQIVITKDRRPTARLISEQEFQRMSRQLAVDGLRALAEKWRARGITWRDLYEENRRDLESRP
ncbi:MAG: type II toxin-antitoxin system Phd/YefM family antitoxin [Acidobacteriota bacterium]